MDAHVKLARGLCTWFGWAISPSSEPGADSRVDALAAKLREWLPGLQDLPRIKVEVKHLRRMACGVQEWMAQGCAPEDMPRLQIAALAELVKAMCTEQRPDYVSAPITDCEACLTPDACAIRGQCAHYLRERG